MKPMTVRRYAWTLRLLALAFVAGLSLSIVSRVRIDALSSERVRCIGRSLDVDACDMSRQPWLDLQFLGDVVWVLAAVTFAYRVWQHSRRSDLAVPQPPPLPPG